MELSLQNDNNTMSIHVSPCTLYSICSYYLKYNRLNFCAQVFRIYQKLLMQHKHVSIREINSCHEKNEIFHCKNN